MTDGKNTEKHDNTSDLDTEINQLLKAEMIIRKIRQVKQQEKRNLQYTAEVETRSESSKEN
jgi:hypothetical protein